MTTYLFGSNFSDTPISKVFETDTEAFDYAHGMTDGPDNIPIWKKIGNHWYGYIQEGWNDGQWKVCDDIKAGTL